MLTGVLWRTESREQGQGKWVGSYNNLKRHDGGLDQGIDGRGDIF